MPFLKLNNSWSDLASYYNQNFDNKPNIPSITYSNFEDGLIRGGLINTGISTVRDVARIGKFFASGKGVLFVAKQVGLQLSNPQLELKIDSEDQKYKTLGPTRQYNLGLNTLASVGGTAFGIHFDRSGILPIINDDQKYGGNIYNTSDGVAYYNNFRTGKNLNINNESTNRLLNYANKIFTNKEGSIDLSDYQGGAQSLYGITPKTTIRTTDQRTTLDTTKISEEKYTGNIISGSIAFTPLTNIEINNAKRYNLNSSLTNQLAESPLQKNKNLAAYNIEKRIGVSTKTNIDAINAISVTDSGVFYKNSQKKNSEVTETWALNGFKNIDGYFGQDIIKFRIEFLNNDAPVTNKKLNTDVLVFRAYLDDFNDGMSAKWNSYRYMGRGEEFFVYEGFTRDISVAFTMYAHSEAEMKPLYQKLNYLMSSFTPDYSSANKMRGNIGYLTVGDYLYRQPGVFTDIKLSGMLETGWDIGYNSDYEKNRQYEVPKLIKVSLSFKPIHTFLPRKAKYINGKSGFNTPFITRDKKSYPDDDGNTTNKYLDASNS